MILHVSVHHRHWIGGPGCGVDERAEQRVREYLQKEIPTAVEGRAREMLLLSSTFARECGMALHDVREDPPPPPWLSWNSVDAIISLPHADPGDVERIADRLRSSAWPDTHIFCSCEPSGYGRLLESLVRRQVTPACILCGNTLRVRVETSNRPGKVTLRAWCDLRHEATLNSYVDAWPGCDGHQDPVPEWMP